MILQLLRPNIWSHTHKYTQTYVNKARRTPELAVDQSRGRTVEVCLTSQQNSVSPHRREEGRQESVCLCGGVSVCSAGFFRQRPEHVDIKALLINTIRFSWELCSAFTVQDRGARGSAAASPLLFAHWLFPTSSPLNCRVLSCSRRKNTVSTTELICVVYREYTSFVGSKKTDLTCVTGDNASSVFRFYWQPHNRRPHNNNVAKIINWHTSYCITLKAIRQLNAE